jgi:hypothetical protein
MCGGVSFASLAPVTDLGGGDEIIFGGGKMGARGYWHKHFHSRLRGGSG